MHTEVNRVRTHTNPLQEVKHFCGKLGSFGVKQTQNDALFDEHGEGVEKDGDEDPGTAHCPMNGWQHLVRNRQVVANESLL